MCYLCISSIFYSLLPKIRFEYKVKENRMNIEEPIYHGMMTCMNGHFYEE
jgi:hypothetical protein